MCKNVFGRSRKNIENTPLVMCYVTVCKYILDTFKRGPLVDVTYSAFVKAFDSAEAFLWFVCI